MWKPLFCTCSVHLRLLVHTISWDVLFFLLIRRFTSGTQRLLHRISVERNQHLLQMYTSKPDDQAPEKQWLGLSHDYLCCIILLFTVSFTFYSYFEHNKVHFHKLYVYSGLSINNYWYINKKLFWRKLIFTSFAINDEAHNQNFRIGSWPLAIIINWWCQS